MSASSYIDPARLYLRLADSICSGIRRYSHKAHHPALLRSDLTSQDTLDSMRLNWLLPRGRKLWPNLVPNLAYTGFESQG